MSVHLIGASSPKEKKLINETYKELDQFYRSFFNNIYNELNIAKYRPIRDAIGLVMRKFESNDHPLQYTDKLVLYIQANTALNHLRLTNFQQKLLQSLGTNTKQISLNFVYISLITDISQFKFSNI
ncbi:bacteriocin immunity protein [Lactobacillus apis]|uniref:bacteriocin immunity protein n=1 Tax=Lactobacillus apis TaxID=303541 RepID=UPI002430B063|nr:bacteriocin immunity protein [Lactobacillus apis]